MYKTYCGVTLDSRLLNLSTVTQLFLSLFLQSHMIGSRPIHKYFVLMIDLFDGIVLKECNSDSNSAMYNSMVL